MEMAISTKKIYPNSVTSEFNNLANLAFNLLTISATSDQHLVAVIAFGTHSRKIFKDKGDSAFRTKNDQLVGMSISPRVDEQS